ncbi:MAG: glycosyltransferase family 4 protein [Leptospiraceae bacterium]|nr:glycosyltransferase family 4 protein [Leptospiraceae bacterium]
MIRIIHLNTARDWRGGERQVYNLLLGLQQNTQIEQMLIARTDSELARRARAEGIRVQELPLRGEWDYPSVRALRQSITEFQAAIVHAHTAKAHSLALWACHQHKSPPALIVSRRVDFPIKRNWLSRKKYFDPLVSRYIAISENIKNILLSDGINADKIDVVHSGIDLSRWAMKRSPARLQSELRLHPDVLVIGNVAALVGHKDQHTLIRTLAVLNQISKANPGDLPAWRCFILGQGELENELTKAARELKLLYPEGPLQFLGFRPEIEEYYALFDIFVLSSREEGLGTAVLDAMAAGLPVAATAAGGIPEMILPEKGGLLAPIANAEALAHHLARLLKDDDLRRKMGQFNRKHVLRFSHENTCLGNLAVYQNVIQQQERL